MASGLTAEQREQLHRRLDEILDRLPPELTDLEKAEEQIEEGLGGLGQATMQAWAEWAGTSPPPPCPECGCSMRHRGLARRTLVTVHSTIEYAQPRRRCKQVGMWNWTRRKTQAVLRLRAAQFDGDFGPLWDARLRLTM